MANKEKLFTEFTAPTTQEWLDKIQVDFNLVEPFLGCRRSKLGKELLFVCHRFETFNYYISCFKFT